MLDVSIRLETLNLLDKLKREQHLALLYVTHELATARHFSSEITVMYRDDVVEHRPSDQVIGTPAHRLLASAAPDPRQARPNWRWNGRKGCGCGPSGVARHGLRHSATAVDSATGASSPCPSVPPGRPSAGRSRPHRRLLALRGRSQCIGVTASAVP
jgi:hypothetical protein